MTGLAWSYDGQELIASYSQRSLALFNMSVHRTCSDFNDCQKCMEEHQNNDENDVFDESDEELKNNDSEDEQIIDVENINYDINIEENKNTSEDIIVNDTNIEIIDGDSNIVEEVKYNVNENTINIEQQSINIETNDGIKQMEVQLENIENEVEEDINMNEEEIENQPLLQNTRINEILDNEVLEKSNRMKSAVSKVKGMMSEIKERVSRNESNTNVISSNLMIEETKEESEELLLNNDQNTNNLSLSQSLKARMKRSLPFKLFAKSSKLLSATSPEQIPFGLELRTFAGHRTVETVKECNFFGPRSEYVISGSDCGHVFIWRKSDGQIINVLKGDSRITNVVQVMFYLLFLFIFFMCFIIFV